MFQDWAEKLSLEYTFHTNHDTRCVFHYEFGIYSVDGSPWFGWNHLQYANATELLQRQKKVRASSEMQNISNLSMRLPSCDSLSGCCGVVGRIGNWIQRILHCLQCYVKFYAFFQACNLMAISIIYFDQPTEHWTSELCSKLKIIAALSLGITGSAMIWCSSCFPRQFRFEMGLSVIFVVSVAFVVLLLAWDARNNIQDQLEDDPQQVSMKTCSLLWKVVKENCRPVLSIALLFVCLLMLSSWSPRSGENEARKDFLYSVITRFVVGIVLPVTFADLIELSKQEDNGLKTAFI